MERGIATFAVEDDGVGEQDQHQQEHRMQRHGGVIVEYVE